LSRTSRHGRLPQRLDHALQRIGGTGGVGWQLQDLRQDDGDQVRGGHAGQIHEPDPPGKGGSDLSRRLDGQTSLAGTAWPGERHQPYAFFPKQTLQMLLLGCPPEEACQLQRQKRGGAWPTRL
jgi:hypothetical protein